MTLGTLIKNKDYDYVSYRLKYTEKIDIFAGCFEWTNPEECIKNGLTVVVPYN